MGEFLDRLVIVSSIQFDDGDQYFYRDTIFM